MVGLSGIFCWDCCFCQTGNARNKSLLPAVGNSKKKEKRRKIMAAGIYEGRVAVRRAGVGKFFGIFAAAKVGGMVEWQEEREVPKRLALREARRGE